MPQAGQLCNLICIFRISLRLLQQKDQAYERGLLGGPCISPDYRVCNSHWGFYGKDGELERRAGRYTESKAMEEMFQSGGSETAVLILHVIFQIQFYLFFAAMHILPHFTSTSPPPRPCYFGTELS